MKFPAKALNYKVPDDLPSHHAAYVEPLACAIHGTHLSPDCYPVAIRMLDKGLPPMDRIVTHQLPLADFQKGIDLVASDSRWKRHGIDQSHPDAIGNQDIED